MDRNARKALALAHRGYVPKHGSIVLEGPAAELARSPAIVEAYLNTGAPASSAA